MTTIIPTMMPKHPELLEVLFPEFLLVEEDALIEGLGVFEVVDLLGLTFGLGADVVVVLVGLNVGPVVATGR